MALHELNKTLITYHDPRSPVSEAFRTLRTNLQFASLDRPIRTLVMTSTAPEEGKSTIAANLAIAIAMAGRTCILVDADLRKPKLHRLFGVSGEVGLTNLLMGGAGIDVLADVGIPGLRILPSGPLPPNPSELLGSNAMTRAMEALAGEADTVIFDTPPIIAVTDAVVLGSKADGVALVLRLQRVSKEALLRAKTLLLTAKARLVGTIVNDVPPGKDNGYYYYYYYE